MLPAPQPADRLGRIHVALGECTRLAHAEGPGRWGDDRCDPRALTLACSRAASTTSGVATDHCTTLPPARPPLDRTTPGHASCVTRVSVGGGWCVLLVEVAPNEARRDTREAVTGTDSQLAAFCERMQPRLLRLITAYVGDVGVAEELVQDALVRVCRDWSKVRRMANPESWTTTVAFNLARSWFRRLYAGRRARRRLESHQVSPSEPDQAAGLVALQALERLPSRQRQALVLRFLDDRSVADTAAVMGCAPGTVRAHTARGLSALRSMDLGLELPDGDHPPSNSMTSAGVQR